LRPLIHLYPEVLFEEELFAFTIPSEIDVMHKKASDYLHDHWSYNHGLSDSKPEGEFNTDRYMTLHREANLQHLQFLASALQRTDIQPRIVRWYNSRANMDYKIPVTSVDEVVEIVRNPNYDNPHIPEIEAIFLGRNIMLDFSKGNGTFGIFNYAVRIENKNGKGTLEDILERVQAIN